MASHDLYSRADETRNEDGELDELPEFDLEYRFDERRWPSEVTVFPAEPTTSILNTWMTVDIEHAIPLEEVA